MAVAHRFLSLFILLSSGVYSLVQAQINPCSNNSHIRDPIRSSAYVVRRPNYEHLICDRNLAPGWYRFNSGLDGVMPTTCPDILHCGTHVPIWLHGSLPTVGQGTVTRDVCGHTPSGCCDYKDTIQVRNCGSFFVYYLKPTRGCSVAYCTGSRVPCPPNKWSASGYGPGCRDQYPIMTQNPILSNPIIKPNTSFVFGCHINFNASRTDIGFAVTWLFDGKQDPSLAARYITGATRDSYIDQKDLAGHLGESISCRAQVYFLNTPNMTGPGIVSNNYWMGLKLSPARLVVGTKDPKQEVQLISTIPMVCNSSATPICRLNLLLEPNNQTSLITTGRTNCNVTLRPQDWDPSTNQAVVKFDVLAQRGILNKDKHLVLHFQRTSTWDAPKIFNHYQVPSLPILYKDSPTAMCSCIGDPHCITLDTMPSTTSVSSMNSSLWNYGYDFQKIGEFLMYNSTNKNRVFEVQIRIWSCSNLGGTCICAVMAREGNDVIRIDMCHQAYGRTFPLVTFPNKGNISQGSMVQQDKAGKTWVISFPSGAVVTVINHAGKDMKVFIHAPEDDRGFTEGLCGTFDGNHGNDLTGKNGVVHKNSGTFAETWRIPIGSSMFDKPPQPDPKLNNDMYFCNCNQAKHLTTCGNDLKHTKPPIPAICPSCKPRQQTQNPGQSGRKKRQNGMSRSDDNIHYYFDYGLAWTPTQTSFPTTSGLTLAGATKLCTDALHRSSAVRQCTSKAGLTFLNEIKMCVEDIKLTDDRDFAQSYVETAIMTCQEFVLRDPSFYNSVTGDPPAFITTELCPSDCSGHGTCIHGTCYCDYGYVDEACSIDSRKPPTLYNIVGSSILHQEAENCDIRRRPCQNIYVVGDNIRDKGPMMKCHLEEYQFSSGKFVPTGRLFETSLEYESVYNVRCHMPAKNQVQGKDVVGYNISISNDDQHYSNAIQAFIIDSDCMSCSEKRGICSIKANTCLIDGQCRVANEQKSGDLNQYCKPDVSNDHWTATQPIPTATPSTHHVATHTDAFSTTDFPTPSPEMQNNRSDIWTFSRTGCTCISDTSKHDCACCDIDGCQCPGSDQQQCVQCGHTENCGHPQPVFSNGLDGYTLSTSDCKCYFNMTRTDCACCQNNGCQCHQPYENQCVRCGSTGHCGAKQWLFGPFGLVGKK